MKAIAAVAVGVLLLGCQDFSKAYDQCVTSGNCEGTAPDAGRGDAGSADAGVDAGLDAGTDAGVDAGVDAGTDAGVDAGRFDGGGCWCAAVQLDDAGTFFSVWGPAENDVWVGGSAGVLLHLLDGGLADTRYPPSSTADIYAIEGRPRPEDNFWVVGKGGLMQHWTGTSWVNESITMFGYFSAVWSPAFGETWAVGAANNGANPIGFHFDQGTRSGPNPLGAGSGINGLWGIAKNDYWAVGNAGTVLHYNGAAWAANTDLGLSTETVSSVWGSRSADVWLVGEQGLVAHFDGGTWAPAGDPVFGTKKLVSIRGTKSYDVWVGAQTGEVFHYDGAKWREEVALPMTLQSLWVYPQQVWVAGSDGGTPLLVGHQR